MTILALSVKAPWAWAIFELPDAWWKCCENRDWPTEYRGPVLIHVSSSCPAAVQNQAVSAYQSVLWRENQRRRLRLYEEEHPPALKQLKNECCKSGNCCLKGPGALTQADLLRLAVHFGLGPREFFLKYCTVVDGRGTNHPVLLRHHQVEEFAGKWLIAEETWSADSPCVFFSSIDGCKVHEVKPAECAEYECWSMAHWQGAFMWSPEELAALGWDGCEWEPEE